MQIAKISSNFMQKTNNHNQKNSSRYDLLNKGLNDVFFTGKNYPSGYYSDQEIEDAKKILENPDWEEKIHHREFIKEFKTESTGELIFCYVFAPWTTLSEKKSAKKIADKYIKNIRNLVIDLNNEKIKKKEKTKTKLGNQAKEKTIEVLVKNQLRLDFLDPLKNNENVPTAVMISENTEEKRESLINWLKKQMACRFIECNEFDEDEIANRIDFELEYAKERFASTGNKVRTVLYVKNMDTLLKEDRPDIKNLMSELVRDKAPFTLLFHTGSMSNIANAYISNRTRIPVKVKFDSSMIDDIKKDTKENN